MSKITRKDEPKNKQNLQKRKKMGKFEKMGQKWSKSKKRGEWQQTEQ